VVDSHVFSNLVYDRVGKGTIMRMMPNPLDIAYAALGNDDALALLGDELAKYPYAPDLEAMRILVDEHGADYWDSTLYTGWLGALRALSPAVGGTTPAGSELPSIALTEGWGRRLTNTQLGSWSELRHDTILYAKQSYTAGMVCEFPDAYVDPYPELFRRLQRFAQQGSEPGSVLLRHPGQRDRHVVRHGSARVDRHALYPGPDGLHQSDGARASHVRRRLHRRLVRQPLLCGRRRQRGSDDR
jgi:hypothetical protein